MSDCHDEGDVLSTSEDHLIRKAVHGQLADIRILYSIDWTAEVWETLE